MDRLQERYRNEIVPALMEQFKYRNPMQVPRLEKVVVNMGVGDAKEDAKFLDAAVEELTLITGQKPRINRARRSVASFKLRAGMPIACQVSLRGRRMYEFVDRLFSVALPRIRDFQGLPMRGFDGHGNYTLGIREQLIFPEIDLDKVVRVRGMNVTLVTTAKTDEEGAGLLRSLGLPLRTAEQGAA